MPSRSQSTPAAQATALQEVSSEPSRFPLLNALLTIAVFQLNYCLVPAAAILGPIYLLFTSWWWVVVLLFTVYAYISYDNCEFKHGRTWRLFCNWSLFTILDTYFQSSLKREGPPLDPKRQYIFAVHPHGNLAFNRVLLCVSRDKRWDKVFPGIETRTLVANASFKIPFIREVFLWLDGISADRKVAEQVLEAKDVSLILYPGGEAEQILTERGRERVWVNDRHGFIRLALHHGTPIVPVYIFGTVDLWHSFSYFYSFRDWIRKRFRIALPLFLGQGYIPLAPFQVKLSAVCAAPIEVEHVPHPSKEKVAEVHKQYIQTLQDLFDRHKAQEGYGDRSLEIY